MADVFISVKAKEKVGGRGFVGSWHRLMLNNLWLALATVAAMFGAMAASARASGAQQAQFHPADCDAVQKEAARNRNDNAALESLLSLTSASCGETRRLITEASAAAISSQFSAFLDARTTPASTRVPVSRANPSTLPDFALFRECEGCPEMVVIPAGTFLMGSPQNEAGRDDDEDDSAGVFGRQVITQVLRFAIARFETTWDEWDACVSATVCKWRADSGFGRSRKPLINVDWETDASAFVRFANGTASGYRLPSEPEWEYVARAGTTTLFSFGAKISSRRANFDGTPYGYGERGVYRMKTTLVGSFPSNLWGVYDMHGNVSEWVQDCYRDNLSEPTTAGCSDVPGCGYPGRVFRGGDWSIYPHMLRSASRNWAAPTYRNGTLAFRLARTL